MALLSAPPPPSNLDLSQQKQQQQQPASSVQPSSSGASDYLVPNAVPILPSIPSVPAVAQPGPLRMPSSKLPKGRHLNGDHVLYDVDVRLQGEVQPQLEVTPITKYVSDPGLVLGRQIAVNKTYICYGLKLGAIRVLNINTALRSLLRGHTQRVTDMAFFAEDVHLLASASIDGRVYVWKIAEGPDEEDKPQITGKIVIAIQIIGEGESVHPRVCWHCHKQEVLVVGIGKRIMKLDTTKVGKGESYSAEEPLKCHIEKQIEGVQFIGKHDGEITDLSMCQWMTTRLVSASTDGTIKIWEDRKSLPLVVLKPHEGQPVNSATFLTAPHRPDHIILITAGPLNREVKLWASSSEEGWLLPSDSESLQCTQTLELKSSSEPQVEDVFFNQVMALPQAGLLLLANAKKNAIYAVHLEYGPHPAATRMDYLAEFTVTMPILSFTGTSDVLPHGEHIVQVYCVQTQAIQQYALDLTQCLPPPLGLDKSDSSSAIAEVYDTLGPFGTGSLPSETLAGSSALLNLPLSPSSIEVPPLQDISVSNNDTDIACVASPPLPLSPRLSRQLSGYRTASSNNFEQGGGDQPVVDRQMDVPKVPANLSDVPSLDIDESKVNKQDDVVTVLTPPIVFKHPTHLITPSEILMGVSTSETVPITEGVETNIQDVVVNNDGANNVEVEVKVVGESQNDEFGSQRGEKSFSSQASDLGVEMARECCAQSEPSYGGVEENRQCDVSSIIDAIDRSSLNAGEEEIHAATEDLSGKVIDSAMPSTVAPPQAPTTAKGKKQKGKNSQVPAPSSPSPCLSNSTGMPSEAGVGPSSMEAAFPQIQAMQGTLNQLIGMQKEMQKQMTAMVNVPITKEGRRLEAALGRSMEKAVKANSDALWARFQEENTKHEKLARERTQQLTGLILNLNRDLPAILEKTVKKELAAVGPAVARTISQGVEKMIGSAIAESFQRGVGDKAVNQLEKSVSSKLEATVARQIQAQFQTSGKQALQESLKSSLEAALIPAFEMSCKAMFEQVDATFQKGMAEHTNAFQQQLESSHSPLALALRDAINSASSMTQTLSGELADGQRKLLALAAAGANSKAVNPLVSQLSNGPLAALHDKVEVPMDPTIELSRLISERKYEEAFTGALQRSDVSVVAWLCSQVDLQKLLSMVPLPLSQGVLLSLLQQLACDISNDTPRKLAWMTDVAAAINSADPMIAMHVRPIFEQVYQILNHHRPLITSGAEISSIRLLMHVINSMLMTCK